MHASITQFRRLSANDLAGLQALGADIGLANMTIITNGDLLHIGAEHAVGNAMRVADAATSNRGLTANFANLRHFYQLQVLSQTKSK